jgi:CheY-like chemotaxis protein
MSNRILAIDDSMAIRTFIIKTLKQNSSEYEILTAKDAEQGLQMAQTAAPDLIILDYILPDMKGDAVCDQLWRNPATHEIPIILMSSSTADIKKAELAYDNVVKSIAKPFTPELLSAMVHHVMRERATDVSSTQVEAEISGPLYSGYSSGFPLHRMFLVAEEENLTGNLRIYAGNPPIECFFRQGRLALVTTRDADRYMGDRDAQFTPDQLIALAVGKTGQRDTGAPCIEAVFSKSSQDSERKRLLLIELGDRLLSTIWTAGRCRYEFESLSDLPEFVPESGGHSVDERLLCSIRMVGLENQQSAIAWGDSAGIPIYTRDGYERIQHVSVNQEEADFLGQVGDATIAEIAQRVGRTPERVQQVLFRFLCLRIFEYWPAALLRGQVSEPTSTLESEPGNLTSLIAN